MHYSNNMNMLYNLKNIYFIIDNTEKFLIYYSSYKFRIVTQKGGFLWKKYLVFFWFSFFCFHLYHLLLGEKITGVKGKDRLEALAKDKQHRKVETNTLDFCNMNHGAGPCQLKVPVCCLFFDLIWTLRSYWPTALSRAKHILSFMWNRL